MTTIIIAGQPHIETGSVTGNSMDGNIVPSFSEPKVEHQPIELRQDANLRFQGKWAGGTDTRGRIEFLGMEFSKPAADFLRINLKSGCGVHGLSGCVVHADGYLDVLAGAGTFMVNIALPFRYMLAQFIHTGGTGGLLDLVAGARN